MTYANLEVCREIVEACLKWFDAGDPQLVCELSASGVIGGDAEQELAETMDAMQAVLGSFPKDLALNYISTNRVRVSLRPILDAVKFVAAVSELEFRSLISRDNFGSHIDSTFPLTNGLMELSWPALDSEQAHALVYFAHARDTLACTGEILMLNNLSGSWKVVRKFICWET